MRTDPAEAIALARYYTIAEATNPRLTPAERGALVRQLAQGSHAQPDGSDRVYARATLDRWVRAYREQGLDGLRPQPRADRGVARRQPDLLEEAARLRREIPARSAAQISAILQARHRVRVAERTIRQYFQRHGLQRAALAGAAKVYGRFEADRPNEIWIGDVLVGPFVPYPRQAGSQRAYLFVLVDDYSRLLLHARWVPEQTAHAGQDVLRAAIQRYGLPERFYCDNGAPLRQCGPGAHLRGARYSPDPQPSVSAPGARQAGTSQPLHPRALPARGRSHGHHELARTERPLWGLDRAGVQCP